MPISDCEVRDPRIRRAPDERDTNVVGRGFDSRDIASRPDHLAVHAIDTPANLFSESQHACGIRKAPVSRF